MQSTSLKVWDVCREKIEEGMLGKVLMYQTEYFRNSKVGQWRNYELTKEMTPQSIKTVYGRSLSERGSEIRKQSPKPCRYILTFAR